MVSKIEDFHRLSQKIVTLPSGLQIMIRKLSLFDFMGSGELPIPAAPENGGQSKPSAQDRRSDWLEIRRMCERAIAAGCVEPRFGCREEDRNRSDILHIDDLPSAEDFNFLAGAILEFSGGREMAAEAESFRTDGERRVGGRASGEIREASNRNPDADAGRVPGEFGDRLPENGEKKEAEKGTSKV